MKNRESYAVVWDNCLEIIKDNISPESYRTWFEPIVPLRLHESVLTIEVPTPFFYEYLEEHFIDLLGRTLRKELGATAKLEYSIKVTREGTSVRLPAQNRPDLKNRDIYPNMRSETPIINPFAYPGIKKLEIDPRLNKNYNFANYIEGKNNNLARSAGMEAAKSPGTTPFNPFFIWGASGLGKTHLAHAIGIETLEKHPDKLVLYVEANKFQNQFIDAAVRQNNYNDFLNFYQMIDVLIIDDIHELSGKTKTKTQNAFFHIFNHLHQSGKQLIFTSDKPPIELRDIDERLVSRFKWGLSTELKKPDMETRTKILKNKIYNDGIFMPDEVVEFIASKVTTNIRELEGSLISLLARSTLLDGKEITIEIAGEMLDKIVTPRRKDIAIDNVIGKVCEHYHLAPELFMSATRKREAVQARQIVMYICRKYCNFSLAAIAQHLNKDHTTVIYASKQIENYLCNDKILKNNVQEIVGELGF